jgi:hypothetical protein
MAEQMKEVPLGFEEAFAPERPTQVAGTAD